MSTRRERRGHPRLDVGPPLDDRRERRRAPGLHGALEHLRLEPVDDGEDELGGPVAQRRMRRPAYLPPSRRRPPASSQPRNGRTSSEIGGIAMLSMASSSATASKYAGSAARAVASRRRAVRAPRS